MAGAADDFESLEEINEWSPSKLIQGLVGHHRSRMSSIMMLNISTAELKTTSRRSRQDPESASTAWTCLDKSSNSCRVMDLLIIHFIVDRHRSLCSFQNILCISSTPYSLSRNSRNSASMVYNSSIMLPRFRKKAQLFMKACSS